ncbi:MAG: undecaprenyl-phosphate glucose phosphotransferase [Rubrobacter sp.]|nr:undecaprenyl-phosphate glucose phosphotransferase [Rubrobacter sp.]
MTVTFDTAAALFSGVGAWWIWTQLLDRELRWWQPVMLVILAVVWVVSLSRSRSLSGRLRRSLLDDLPTIMGQVLLASMAVVLSVALIRLNPDNAGPVVVATGLGILTVPTARGFSYALLNRERSGARRKVLIVGAGKVGNRVAHLISKNPQIRAEVVGFLDKEPLVSSNESSQARWPVLANSYDLGHILREYRVDEVIIAFSTAPHQRFLEMIWECDRHGVNISFVPRLFETTTVQSVVEDIGGIPLMHLNRVRLQGYNAVIKRTFDVLGAGFGLALLWPLLLLIAVAVKLDSPGPILFSQRRVGYDGETFAMYKFRSMRVDAEQIGTWTKKQDPRRTRVGRFLRPLNLDELPQLFNVIKGDMSLVGPRPEQPSYVELFEESVYRYSHRHRVKSGITGWAQVNGFRGDTSIDERILFDNYYIENWSLWLDIKIIILTLFKAGISKPERDAKPRANVASDHGQHEPSGADTTTSSPRPPSRGP